MGKIGLFDLEKHFAFYGAYHSNPINVAIHMLLVWPILFTAILILYFTPSVFNFSFSIFGSHFSLALNFGFFLAVVYSVFYVCLDPKAGSLAAFLCMLCWVASSFLAGFLGFSLAWKVPFWIVSSFSFRFCVFGSCLFCRFGIKFTVIGNEIHLLDAQNLIRRTDSDLSKTQLYTSCIVMRLHTSSCGFVFYHCKDSCNI